MQESKQQDSICALIERASQGDRDASNVLLPMIYAELRQRAKRALYDTGCPDGFSTTVLVNEAYLKLFDGMQINAHCRAQFLSYAASTMRSILIDAARSMNTKKRTLIESDDLRPFGGESPTRLFAVDEALERLKRVDARMAQIVEMRFFAGMTAKEISLVLGVTERTVERDWSKARVLLAASKQPVVYHEGDTQPLG